MPNFPLLPGPYQQVRFYKAHALKVREHGEGGWAVHVYAQEDIRFEREIAVISTFGEGELASLIKTAQALVDVGLSEAEVLLSVNAGAADPSAAR